MTANGGSNNLGAVFSINSDGSGYTVLKSFTGADGSHPYRGLIEGADSLLYGTTITGGSSTFATTFGTGFGTVFRMSKDGTFFQVLVNFDGLNGGNPACSLMQDSDGWLYGTTYNGSGKIFKLRPDGTSFSVLKTFNPATDGAQPSSGLIEGDNGVLFGTTTRGGNSENGATIYRINKDGSGFAVIKSLFGSDGDTPSGGLTLCSDHYLYGTSVFGGSNALIPIVSPGDDMLQGSGGPLYGANGRGTIFKLKQDGSDFTVLRQFANGSDGALPLSTLAEDLNGYLWGTTEIGYYYPNNTYNSFAGSVFKIKKDGSDYQIVKSFSNSLGSTGSGAHPIEGVIRGMDGAIYGTTLAAGAGGSGTIFKISCNGLDWDFDAPTAVSACGGSNVVVTVLNTALTNSDGCAFSYVRTWLAVDECGNTNTCSQIVTVADTIPPFVYPDRDKIVDGQQSWNFDTPTGEDACDGGVKISVNVASTVTNEYCPMKITRTWAVTDNCGNASLCTQTVTVTGAAGGNDTTPPVIDCPTGSIVVPLNADCQLEVPVIHPNATDDFTPVNQLTYIQDPPPGRIVPGPCYTITLTVIDACGNASKCEAQVCGQSKTPPRLIAPASVTVTDCVVPDVLGLVSIAANPCASSDLTFTQSPPAGTPIAAGGNIVTVTGTDPNGNSSSVFIPLVGSGLQSFLDELFNTGVDNTGALLASGSIDPHYTLGPVPSGIPVGPGHYNVPSAVVVTNPWYLPPFSDSRWIAPATSPEGLTDGIYTYTNQFVLPAGVDAQTASISGRWAADNDATMYLNGLAPANQVSSIVSTNSFFIMANGFDHWTYFTVASGFQAYPAVNTLYFLVTNQPGSTPNYTGLRVEYTGASANCSTCTPPVILYTKPDQSLPVGSAATLSVTVWGTPTLSYQWYHNGTALANGGHYSGVDTPNLTVASLSTADAGTYYVIVSNGCGSIASHPRKLTVVKNYTDKWAWWNFTDIRNPLTATIGPDLVFHGTNHFGVSGGTTFDFGLPSVGGKIANVLYVPPLMEDNYIRLPYVGPDGTDTLTDYTLVMDFYSDGGLMGPAKLFSLRDNWALTTTMSPGGPGVALEEYVCTSSYPGGPVTCVWLDFVTAPLPPNNWNRIAVVMSSTDGISVYLNGKLIGNAGPRSGPITPDSIVSVVSSPEGNVAGSYVSSIAFFTDALTPQMLAGLGSPDNGPIFSVSTTIGMSPLISATTLDGMIQFSWPDTAFTLQETSDLGAEWQDSYMPFEETADARGKITMTVRVNPANGTAKFFRLKSAP
ncbi:MAG: immunoglobulin domain-containing protein [Limisphaerales bacterium]